MPGSSAPQESTFARRVRRARERRGLTRAAAAGRVGKSSEWWKAIETGRLRMPRLPMLLRMADVLALDDLADLTGDARLASTSYRNPAHPALPHIRSALATYRLAPPAAAPPTVAALTARIRHAWLVWHGIGHHRSSVAELLPALLADAQHAARALDGADRRKALALLAQAYHLTQLYLSFQPTPELVILAGDRAMAAAQDADDPRAIAAAAWYMGHIHRDSGEAAAARVDLALQAASLLRPEAHQEDLALHGLLHLAVALSHAKTAGAGKAEHHWDIADRAASALGESYAHPWLVFGRGVVDGYALTIRTDLVQTRAAVRIAADLRTQTVPSATRRAYHVIEQARAYSLAGEPIATVHFLSQAQRISPETTSFNLFARSAVSDLASFGPAAIRPQATALAREWGVDAA